jgi:tetratricopeptide (TPR) repeat protein
VRKSLGDLERRLGNIDQARAHYDAALPLYRMERARLGEANLLQSLGDLERRLGNIDQARAHYDAALLLYRMERARLGEANVYLSLGDMFMSLKQWEQARAYYEQALPLYITERDLYGQANTLIDLGGARFELGEHEQGLKDVQQAVRLFHTVQNEEWARRAELCLLEMQTRLGQAGPDGELIDNFVGVQSPQQMFELAQQHPQLLTNLWLALIKELIATQTDNQVRQQLSERLGILEQIRQGVEEKATVQSTLDNEQKTKEKKKT